MDDTLQTYDIGPDDRIINQWVDGRALLTIYERPDGTTFLDCKWDTDIIPDDSGNDERFARRTSGLYLPR